ncbi:MAG: ribonuclease III [Acidobacteriota bacterium]
MTTSDDNQPGLEELERIAGHVFRDRELLLTAVTHRSYAHETAEDDCVDNEALEFLGDAVLAFRIADRLYRRFPGLDEGRLSKHKSMLEKAATLADAARDLRLGTFLRLGRGERRSGGATNDKILSNAFEALVAATYLDGGLKAVDILLDRALADRMEGLDAENPINDYKSALQEETQGRGLGTPEYVVFDEQGPDHDKRFHVRVLVGGETVAEGVGLPTKRGAQQVAARRALERLQRGEWP